MSLIYRQAAIDALDCINGVEEVLRSLPSAQPEIIHCKDCKYADNYCHCKYVTWWNGPDDYCSRGKKKGEAE